MGRDVRLARRLERANPDAPAKKPRRTPQWNHLRWQRAHRQRIGFAELLSRLTAEPSRAAITRRRNPAAQTWGGWTDRPKRCDWLPRQSKHECRWASNSTARTRGELTREWKYIEIGRQNIETLVF